MNPTPNPDPTTGRTPTDFEKQGMTWWNGLSHRQRDHHLADLVAAGITPSPANAWASHCERVAKH